MCNNVVHYPALGRARSSPTPRDSAPTAPSPWPTSTNVIQGTIRRVVRANIATFGRQTFVQYLDQTLANTKKGFETWLFICNEAF